jgi:hypothetical protein
MAHQFQLESGGVLRLTFIGDTDRQGVEKLVADFQPFLAQVTAENPLLILWDDTRGGKASVDVRKVYADFNRDPRIGKVAIFGAQRYGRVLGEFVLKLTGRNNIRFFDNEAGARAWLTA